MFGSYSGYGTGLEDTNNSQGPDRLKGACASVLMGGMAVSVGSAAVGLNVSLPT
jgi:hypothetical protein